MRGPTVTVLFLVVVVTGVLTACTDADIQSLPSPAVPAVAKETPVSGTNGAADGYRIPPVVGELQKLVQSGDVDGILGHISTVPRPCGPSAGEPHCTDGDTPGTTYEVLPIGTCDAGWVPLQDLRSEIERLVSVSGDAYGVGAMGPPYPGWLTAFGDTPYGELIAVFSPRKDAIPESATAVYFAHGEIVRLQIGCHTDESLLRQAQDVLWRRAPTVTGDRGPARRGLPP